jgi:nicotinate-nucleotide--dimethylbenzimidazole phosphoribosyltransferase
MAAARERQARLTKPPGSLGRLEELAERLAGIQARPLPSVARKAVLTLAADHGVAAEGVSRYPQSVTREMVANFRRGGAAINALAGAAGARVVVADFGVKGESLPVASETGGAGSAGETGPLVRYVGAKLADGTANLANGPAMPRSLAVRAVEQGMRLLEDEYGRGLDAVALGEMGIANTTAASCLAAVLAGAPVERVTGRGTGLDDAQLAAKRAVVARALRVNAPDPDDALDALAKVGGLEIAGLAGVALAAAARRVVIVVDGFISAAAALVAARLAPRCAGYMVAAHESVEPGHRVVLDALRLEPLLNLRLRLGEGTGAALAFSILEAACRAHREMATFAEAGVSDVSDDPNG